MRYFDLRTSKSSQLIDITQTVQAALAEMHAAEGVCVVFAPHTTAGITINENADPSVASDLLSFLDRMVPADGPYTHGEGNSPGHIKALITGSSVIVPVAGGRLQLGTWQGIFFCEFDGPRQRRFGLTFLERGGPENVF